jgi:cyclopropane-fatty-acyl-phospholipid synthase
MNDSMRTMFTRNDARTTIAILEVLTSAYGRRDFAVRLWDGSTWGDIERPRFTLVLKHPSALRKLFSAASEVALGEAFIYDDVDIEGNIEAAFDLADYLLAGEHGLAERLRLGSLLFRLPDDARVNDGRWTPKLQGSVHSKQRDRQAVSYHYDVSNDFYALWLDSRMVYSCGYFQSEHDDLDVAQEQKLEYLCRKLRLRRGDRLLDLGCGWGGLMQFAAAKYGVEALGVTLSVPQAELARERLRRAKISDRCRVEVSDYRDLDLSQQYDKIVSVGMFEHVGEALLPDYFSQAWALLRPGGVFLNHGIAASATFKRRGPSFVDKYVFPDGELVPVHTTLRAAEACGFEVRDVESLREHYMLTLRHWVRRLEAKAKEARKITDDITYRVWRLYMSGAAHGFQTGRLNIHQTLLSKTDHGKSRLPLTRGDWYAAES